MSTDLSETPEPVPTTEPTVHVCGSTGEAYDQSQYDDNIRSGDVLYVPSEKAAAILYLAWPLALPGYERGEFHGVNGQPHPGMEPWFERGLKALQAHL